MTFFRIELGTVLDCKPGAKASNVMTPLDRALLRRLGIALMLKLAILTAIWWAFVRHHAVDIQANGVAERFLGTPVVTAKGPNT